MDSWVLAFNICYLEVTNDLYHVEMRKLGELPEVRLSHKILF